MNKDNKQMMQKNNELSIWELVGLMRKNWLLLSIVIIMCIVGGLIYSFAIQEQNVTVYSSNKAVMFSDWKYYPDQIYNTYASDLKTYINNEFEKEIIISSTLKQYKNIDNTIDYSIQIDYSADILKSEAEDAAAYAVLWHNQMVESEIEKIQRNFDQSLNDFRSGYEDLVSEYYTFVSDADMASVENMVTADLIKSESEIYLETWTSEKEKLQKAKNDLIDAEHYYLESLPVSTSVKSTWKLNIIVSIALGFIIAFILILLKESYRSYKKDK